MGQFIRDAFVGKLELRENSTVAGKSALRQHSVLVHGGLPDPCVILCCPQDQDSVTRGNITNKNGCSS